MYCGRSKNFSIPTFFLATCLGIVGISEPARTQSFNNVFVFGDSNVESGWFRYTPWGPASQPPNAGLYATALANGGGHATTPYDLNASQLLASYFGLSADPANAPGGGTNYAIGGSSINSAAPNTGPGRVVTQINNYLSAVNGVANSQSLYLIQGGGVDTRYAVIQLNSGAFTLAQANQYVIQAANDLIGGIARLHAAGARYFIVPVGGSGTLGIPIPGGPGTTFRNTLWYGLEAAGIQFIPAYISPVFSAIYASPAAFGFQYVLNTQPACINPSPTTIFSNWSYYCTPQLLVSPDAAQTHLYADDNHFTAAGQKILADYYYSLVVAPSQISFLAETAVQTTFGMITGIQQQIGVSQRQRPYGANAWFNGSIAALQINNAPGFPDDPSTPVTGTLGFDYHWQSGWLIGAAVSLGTQKSSFSLGGNFKQDEAAISLYAGYRNGPWWGNVIGSYGYLHYDVDRAVPIGITIQSNTASTSGSDLTLAGELGYDLKTGWLTHGPVVGLVLQQVHINGFTEAGNFTALSFGSQTRNSEVSAIGYRASFDWGIWHPFVQVVWNHEFDSLKRVVTASLTTIAAPSYSMPAVVVGRNWATETIGTQVKLAKSWTGLASFTAQTWQTSVTNYGGRIGLNYAFD